jgi:chaperonin cofactor prefoldin
MASLINLIKEIITLLNSLEIHINTLEKENECLYKKIKELHEMSVVNKIINRI